MVGWIRMDRCRAAADAIPVVCADACGAWYPTNTVWIRLVVLAQAAIFAFATVALIQVQSQMLDYFAAFKSGSVVLVQQRQAALFGNPWYLGNLIFPFAACGASVLLAYLDRKALQRRGYDRPFHWAWVFLGLLMYACSLVYVIGRTIVIRRRGGRGAAPLVASIMVEALGIIAVIAYTAFWVTQILATS